MKNRDDIVRHMTAKFGSEHRLTDAIVKETFAFIKQTLVSGEIVRISHFGMFQSNLTPAHSSYTILAAPNPMKLRGARNMPARNHVSFRAFRKFSQDINA